MKLEEYLSALLAETRAIRELLYAQERREMERLDYARELMRQAEQQSPSGAAVSPAPVPPSKDPVRELLEG